MQLKRLYIKDYKILKDFAIEFPYDFKRYISVFIGANGSGKSTILEAIANIYSCIILSEKAKFDFKIEYSITSDDIISGFSINNPKLEFIPINIVGDTDYIPKAGIDFNKLPPDILKHKDTYLKLSLAQRDFRNLMPDNIIIYYSGLSEIMEEISKPHEEKLSKAYRKGNTDIDRDFFYYKPEHFEIILLSLLSYEYGDVPQFLKNKGQIHGMQSVQIVLKEPHWAESSSLINDFWGASGNVRKFLDFVCHTYSQKDKYDFLDYSIIKKNVEVVEISDEKLQIIIKGQNALFTIKDFLGEERLLFEVLVTMLHDDFIDEISFDFIKEEDKQTKQFSILSEGEQQEIALKGLVELLPGKNTLFLFDEPDTYLHPEWQRQLIPGIQETIEKTVNSENLWLIATHSPNIVSGVKSENLFVLNNGQIKEIPFNSFGKNVDSLLIDFFGVKGVRNIYVENLLMEIQRMVKKKQFNSPEFKKKFKELKDVLSPTAPEIVNINLEIAKSRKK